MLDKPISVNKDHTFSWFKMPAKPAVHLELLQEAKWIYFNQCPACGSINKEVCGNLPDAMYIFGEENILFPASGISLLRCTDCTLVYKNALPDPEFLSSVFSRQMANKWTDTYQYDEEIRKFTELLGDKFDLLDVGASNGALLEACKGSIVNGRQSALDIIAHPQLLKRIKGEFIQGFLDHAQLAWLGEPYEIVTLFDVLEHLYDPENAFKNLRLLVKDNGIVFLETGNTKSFWPVRYGVHQWWYTRLFEHHMFWSYESLEKIASRHGFKIICWHEKHHKSRNLDSPRIFVDLLKVGLYKMLSSSYTQLAQFFGRNGVQPWSPFTKDHVQVVLKKI